MNSNIVIIALLQIALVCTPLVWQAAALDQYEDPDQLWDISRELFQDCLKQRNSLQAKNHRMMPPLDLVLNSAKLQQGDLLRELLATEVVSHVLMHESGNAGISQKNRHDNNRYENWFLKELTAEASMP